MNLKELLSDDRAVSPVIGVILMVAITVILAAVIGTFVLGLGDQVSQTTPNASFQFDYEKNELPGNDTLEVVHGGGDTVASSELNASITGAFNASDNTDVSFTGDLYASGDVSAGSSYTINGDDFNKIDNGGPGGLALNESTVRVVWQSSEGDSSAQLGTWNGPDA